LDITQNTKLENLMCDYNQLGSLDVSKNLVMTYLTCEHNQLTALDISKNTALTTLRCSINKISALDVTKNIALTTFECNDNQLSTLDVTKNTVLNQLYCNNNKISALDVTSNTALKALGCGANLLTALDVTKNSILTSLSCDNNRLSTLDVTKNTALTHLWCNYNQLTALDVSKNTALIYFQCEDNQLSFKTLPLKQLTWTTYTYAPQAPVSIAKTLSNLDFNDQYIVNGNTTQFTWRAKSGKTLVEGTDYAFSNGIFYFLKSQTDSAFCLMTNSVFPDFSLHFLSTTNTKITSPSAVNDAASAQIEIYVHNKILYINSPYNAQFSVFDINGRLLLAKEISSGTNNFPLTNSGIYLVKINGKETITQKVIVE
jgi:hypothetical protein